MITTKSAQRTLAGFVSVRRLAESYHISKQAVWQQVRRNVIPYLNVGPVVLVDGAAYDAHRASRAPRRAMRSSWRDDLETKE